MRATPVTISHAGALNTILAVNRRFGVNEGDRVFAISSLCFDLSVYDLFGAAAAGAGIVMPSGKAAADPQSWLQTMRDGRVTVFLGDAGLAAQRKEVDGATHDLLGDIERAAFFELDVRGARDLCF